ncbi:hypothetical protein [Pseudomonas sp. GV047]|uniref:hypothetical protein n=1 Tax=Pseudomonas sp. GV047 TaxID=2135751 RepID=UPI000D475723|nr:hypothetical protein [Pseudomonas sp. GV047]PUB39616.1 hypothetical protein C8K58_1153 [Pseudomonas sp. GV047]
MKPFSRVVALDNNQEDLDSIVRALGRAGYSAIPYLFDVGEFVPPITQPCSGLRLIFSDIHLTPTSSINGVDHAATIGNFLKQIVPTGPYGVIFWSKHEADEHKIVSELMSRAPDIGFNLPVFFGFMDKNKVGIGAAEADIDYELFAKLIYGEVAKSQSLSIVMNWEERILLAATQASNSLFQVIKNAPGIESEFISEEWLKLLAFLSQEAVGKAAAISNASGALDNALLPVLEDQLRAQPSRAQDVDNAICEKLSALDGAKLKLSASIDTASLNSFYLVEDFNTGGNQPYNFRGVISKLNDNPENFISAHFGAEWAEVLYKEFIVNGETIATDETLVSRTAPCLISLSAECDEVQGKIPSHRYLLGVIFDATDLKSFLRNGQPARAALQNIGKIKVGGVAKCILVSCRRFTSEHSVSFSMPITPIARLRRNTLEEIMHHYTTHARRPGVMRFY